MKKLIILASILTSTITFGANVKMEQLGLTTMVASLPYSLMGAGAAANAALSVTTVEALSQEQRKEVYNTVLNDVEDYSLTGETSALLTQIMSNVKVTHPDFSNSDAIIFIVDELSKN